ncbi:MAG: hypothetical protein IPO25_22685 [Saprospiraceae bacterium]|nr:hypothetical protein [Saprospiraceae bacterium]
MSVSSGCVQPGSDRVAQSIGPDRAFRQYDTAGINSSINSAILEAIGRTGTAYFLHAMATVETYEPTDTLLLLAKSGHLSIYAQRYCRSGRRHYCP